MRRLSQRQIFIWLFLMAGCVEPYNPPEINASLNYLVVDGFINDSNKPTVIRLTRTTRLNEEGEVAEADALVKIESDNGSSFELTESAPGYYTIKQLMLNANNTYRLFIRTKAGKDYASDFVDVNQTPEIDSISWVAKEDGIRLYVNTHDEQNNTWYYRWQYEETWKINSAFESNVKFQNDEVRLRNDAEQIYNCWNSKQSTNLLLGTSIKLNEDKIHMFELLYIPPTSVKLSNKFSLLVREFGLSQEAYQYWQILKKNSETLGTLFDPQPSQLKGNIRCLNDASETVIGFISACRPSEKRIFISKRELPQSYRAITGLEGCETDTISADPTIFTKVLSVGDTIPIRWMATGSTITGYIVSSAYCVDCRTIGTNVKPDFWE